MKPVLASFAIYIAPYLVVIAAFVAFAYFAPCGCMGGCSPANTPNRCQPSQVGGRS